MRKSYKYPTRGFTLVELMVAIGVFAILSVLLVSATKKALAASRSTKCASQLHQIAVSFNSYAVDHVGVLPVIDMWTTANSANAKFVFWISEIGPYLNFTNMPQNNPFFRCPEVMVSQPKTYNSSSYWRYGLNSGLCPADSTGAKNGVVLAGLDSPGSKVMVFCTGRGWTSIWYSQIMSAGAGDGYGPFSATVNAPFFAEVHGGRANVLFADGHIAASRFLETASQDWKP